MSHPRFAAGAALLLVIGLALIGLDFRQPEAVYSQSSNPVLVVNTSGQALPVIDGTTGAPARLNGQPWVIPPGGSFGSYPWQGNSRFVYGGVYYHYIGNNAAGPSYQFYLVEDWVLNQGVLTPAEGDAAGETFVPVVPAPPNRPAAVPTLPGPPLPTLAPPTPTPQPTATALPTYGNYKLFNIQWEPNCGLTAIKGYVVNPDGIGRDGVKVKLTSGDYTAISNFTDKQGYYDITLAGEAKAGTWTLQVWIEDTGQSAPVTVQTDTNDCRPNGSGRQVIRVDWIRVDTNKP